MSSANKQSINILNDQVAAGVVLGELQNKAAEQASRLREIPLESAAATARANEAFSKANEYIERCRDFVSPGNMEHILGAEATKHGEVAETLEVNFRNGRDVLNQLKATAKVLEEGADRIGPSDYIINGDTPVQSKFINGGNGEIITPNNSLRHIFEHLKKYPGYANDTTAYGFPGQHGIYHMPKDQYEMIDKIQSGDTDGISFKTIKATKDFIEKIEEETGKPFAEVVKPGLNTYSDVQLGRVDDTINKEEAFYESSHKEQIKEINEEERAKLDEAKHITDASWSEAFKAAGIAAIISGATNAGLKIYSKIKSGTKLTEFSLDDWKDVGIDFTKGSARGGISGLSIYGLTKLGGFDAPFAGGLTTSAIGVCSLFIDYKSGKINSNDFADSANAICIESGMAAIGAAIGQAIIPIPVVGAIVGTQAMQFALKITKQLVGEKEQELISEMQRSYEEILSRLDKDALDTINEIDAFYKRIGGLIEATMSPELNCRLTSSIILAQNLGVPDITYTTKELDDFIQS